MKKSILNIAVSMALSSALFSGSVLSTQAYADGMITDEVIPENIAIINNDTSNPTSSETYLYPGMGVGAATGTLVAGPAGFVVGGLFGAIFGSRQDKTNDPEKTLQTGTVADSTLTAASVQKDEHISIDEFTAGTTATPQTDTDNNLYLAQLGSIDSVIEEDINLQQEDIMNILVSDLSLDVYFRSGSTDIEKFYPARLTAIADLVNTMNKLELHLDGYTDRRGDKTQNLALANERIDKVREQLINAGVDESRIVSKAFGEAKMKSAAGNLEAYTFDRRVVIRFERSSSISDNAATALKDTSFTDEARQEKAATAAGKQVPVVADAAARF